MKCVAERAASGTLVHPAYLIQKDVTYAFNYAVRDRRTDRIIAGPGDAANAVAAKVSGPTAKHAHVGQAAEKHDASSITLQDSNGGGHLG